MSLALYDTWSRTVRPFTPIRAGQVGMYCCGPTVYDDAHIGNLRTYVFEDLLRRVLERNGYAVRQVVNITDVGHLTSDADEGEDKMEKGSRRTGESAWAIARRYTDAFVRDWHALNLLEPTVWCRATDHIAEQIAFIDTLDRAGYVYRTDDGLYFDTSRQDDYGYLARLDRAGLQAGKRVALGGKRSITDFALWKFSPAGVKRQMEWDSPWGRGFPGWHIECSAMSAKYLDVVRYPLRRRGSYRRASQQRDRADAGGPRHAARELLDARALPDARRRYEDVEVERRLRSSADLAAPRCRSARVPLSVPDGPLSKQAAFHVGVARRGTHRAESASAPPCRLAGRRARRCGFRRAIRCRSERGPESAEGARGAVGTWSGATCRLPP